MAAVAITTDQIVIDLKTITTQELSDVVRHIQNLAGDREAARQARLVHTPVAIYDPLESSYEEIAAVIPALEKYILNMQQAIERESVYSSPNMPGIQSKRQLIAQAEKYIATTRVTLAQRQPKKDRR